MALSAGTDAGEPAVAALVVERGPLEAWRAVVGGLLGAGVAERLRLVDPSELQRTADRAGIRFVVPGDPEWPAGLADLTEAEPIQRRGGLPVGLWVRGPADLARRLDRSVAVVGSRAATAYGAGIAADLSADLADRGVTVVSGGAFGIDTAAHRGALSVSGPTIAVLANGVDVGYPQANAKLFEALGRDHLLVSELPPGAHPTRVRFLSRNRLIAAMTRGTVVVEAALRSGARNTASWASECGRVLMAVPGPVHSRSSVGPHLMIRSGQAVLVTGATDVLELVSGMGEDTIALSHGPQRATDGLTDEQLAVFEVIPARRRVVVGEIAMTAGLSVPQVLTALAALEATGLVTADDRGWLALPAGTRSA